MNDQQTINETVRILKEQKEEIERLQRLVYNIRKASTEQEEQDEDTIEQQETLIETLKSNVEELQALYYKQKVEDIQIKKIRLYLKHNNITQITVDELRTLILTTIGE